MIGKADVLRWKADPLTFITEVCIDPETGAPFELYEAQEIFLRRALTLTPAGRLPFPELVYSCPKKSGKTATAALSMLYVIIVIGGKHAEGYAVANDLEQAQGRVFEACRKIIMASPILKQGAKITANRIEFMSTGSTITALASDYASAAGSNPTFVCFDELWAYTSERSRRLWDEMVPPPTRKVTARLTTTYAGFEGESALLWSLYQRGLKGTEVAPRVYQRGRLLMAWHHDVVAPWQSQDWLDEMQETLRPNAYARMIRNEFVSSATRFIEPEWYDDCVDPNGHPVISDPRLSVWVGVDASVKRDSTAIAWCTWDDASKQVRLIGHRIWQPSAAEPLDFETTIAKTVRELDQVFHVEQVLYDPYQMAAVAQQLLADGILMVEYPQTSGNLTDASSNLYELIKGGNLVLYPDAQIRTAILQAVAVENPRGWKIAKEKQAHKIDVVVALSMAALGAVREGPSGCVGEIVVRRRQDDMGNIIPTIRDEIAAAGGLLGPTGDDPSDRGPNHRGRDDPWRIDWSPIGGGGDYDPRRRPMW